MGFAYQSLGNFDMALKHYMRYSLTKENDVWNLKHIAACHRAMGNHADAAVYYAKALELKPSDITLSLTLGHCYVETGNYEKALKEYVRNKEDPDMSKTASLVMKIIGASLAFAAVVCLLIGGWHDLSVGYCGRKKRLTQKFGNEYEYYSDEELYE